MRSDSGEKEYPIEWLRMQKRTPILKISGVDDRASAEALTDSEVYALLSESRPNEEGVWLVSELVGLEVFSDEAGRPAIGRIESVIDNPAHEILEIRTEGTSRLLPFIDAFVREVDTEGGRIVIVPPDGWFEQKV